ncbi:MAG: AAA family ATPase [Kiritimatiellae bacterium]|nr:AAA family ATPase [Kiritimatiellia bacterium]
MYVHYWNLREKPFQNVTDVRFAYLAEQHHEGLARLIYLAKNQKIGGVLIGPYGVGKSMILELLAQNIRSGNNSKYLGISMMPGETMALARRILEFTGYSGVANDMTGALEALQSAVGNPKNEFPPTVLAIDEAQMIVDKATWQFLHLLTNITVPSSKDASLRNAFTLILCGHIDLTKHLKLYQALAQRLQLVWKLEPLIENQTVEYIQQRIRAAGGDIWIFSDDAMRAIHRSSNGLPRLINNLCDTALMLGCAGQVKKITKEIAEQAAADSQCGLLAENATQQAGGYSNA